MGMRGMWTLSPLLSPFRMAALMRLRSGRQTSSAGPATWKEVVCTNAAGKLYMHINTDLQ